MKRDPLRGLFLCFTTYFAIFLPKNLHMSNNCCTFALEIGKGRIDLYSAGKRRGQRRGATFEEYPAENTIPQACGAERE